MFGNKLDKSAHGYFHTRTKIDRFSPVVIAQGRNDTPGSVCHVQEFAGGRTVAPDLDRLATLFDRFYTLADESRNNVGGSRVKIVTGTIEIDRQKVNRVKAVLLAVSLAL